MNNKTLTRFVAVFLGLTGVGLLLWGAGPIATAGVFLIVWGNNVDESLRRNTLLRTILKLSDK